MQIQLWPQLQTMELINTQDVPKMGNEHI